jgi:hypothetical protein
MVSIDASVHAQPSWRYLPDSCLGKLSLFNLTLDPGNRRHYRNVLITVVFKNLDTCESMYWDPVW